MLWVLEISYDDLYELQKILGKVLFNAKWITIEWKKWRKSKVEDV